LNKTIHIPADQSHTIQSELKNLQNKLYDLSARNPFINVKLDSLWDPNSESSKQVEKVYKKALFFQKEYGLETTLSISVFLKWKEPAKDRFYISPFVFKPCKIQKTRKIDTAYSVEIEEDQEFMINPILKQSLNRFYDINFPETSSDINQFIESFSEQLSTKEKQIITISEFNKTEEWQLITASRLGNFNYKKSLLGQDFNSIIESPSKQIVNLINKTTEDNEEKTENPTLILPLDFSQRIAVERAMNGNLVIQGPPGTGKSHTIVALIGAYLKEGKKILFVSQKRSALDVVYERLKQSNLNHLVAYFNTEKDEKKSFYSHLKRSWDQLLIPRDKLAASQSDLEDGVTSFYIDKLCDYNLKLDDSLQGVIKELATSGLIKKDLDVHGAVPNYREWKLSEEFLKQFEDKYKKEFDGVSLGKSSFSIVNKAVFTEADPLLKLEKRTSDLIDSLLEINTLQKKFGLSGSLEKMTHYAVAGSILNMVNQNQLDLLNTDSKSYKSFGNWAKKYQLLKAKIERSEVANSKWKIKPTKSEITELTDLLKHHEAPRGILGILKRRSERVENAFAGFDKGISTVAKLQLLEEMRTEWNLKGEVDEIKLKLKHNFNIGNPETEIDHIFQLRNKLSDVTNVDYLKLLENGNSLELIQSLNALHPKIQNYNHLSRFIFRDNSDAEIEELIIKMKKLQGDVHNFKLILPELKQFFSMSPQLRNFILNNPDQITLLKMKCAYHNLIEQSRFEVGMDKLSGYELEREIKTNLIKEKSMFSENGMLIENAISATIRQKEALLSTPASKLSERRKTDKKNYRIEKKLIIHEMSKKQQHMGLKSFVEESWETLSDVHPIWMMNPLSVAERLNCKEDLFDVVIFDESSQIPLEDAVPSIYRSKQVIVVGDEKQMPPSQFFSTKTDGITILDQAEYTYPKEMLKWHYRSEYPSLISFSNRHFYENELLTIPPVDVSMPIEFIKLNGVFKEGINEIEAVEIAKKVAESKIKLSEIGIISFSREQENEIRKQLVKRKVSDEELLIRNLENVQGIERDYIFISVGYAKDQGGNFRMNFGPVNQQNGANRLNVLFTRAKKKMTIFSSVDASDFKPSDNQGVSCLKDFLFFAQEESEGLYLEKSTASLPYNIDLDKHQLKYYSSMNGSSVNCFVQHASSKILLFDPCLSSTESADIKTIYSILKERFKFVKIILSMDVWNNIDRVENEVDSFFK
jgi:superfamily I DNA and/or RNA helicase